MNHEKQYEFIGTHPPFPASVDASPNVAANYWLGYRIIRINALGIDLLEPFQIWIRNAQSNDGEAFHQGVYTVDGELILATDPGAGILAYVWPDIAEEIANG